ncbi:MAG: PA14 domain-containing protein [Pseudomonadota bacterium]
MEDQEFQAADGNDADDAKKNVARNIANAGDAPSEDPSRATLHYGEDVRAELGGDAGAPTAAAESEATEAPAQDDTVEGTTAEGAPTRAPLDVSSDAEPQTSDRVEGGLDASNRQTTAPTDTPDATSGLDVPGASASLRSATAADAPSEEAGPTPAEDGPTNVAPTEIQLDSTDVAENADGAVIGQLTVIDRNAGDTHTFTVSDDRFEVVDGFVRLKPGVTLDHEEAASIQLEVTATDQGGLSVTQTFDITVTDVNDGPTSVSLDAASVAENADGAVVGQLSTVDPDAGDTHTYSVSDDRFEVVGGEVRLKPGVALDHEEAASIELQVTATDSGGLSLTETFEITVTDVNEGPTSVSLDASTVAENDAGAVVGRLSTIDPDAGDTHTYSVSDDRFEVVGGEVRLKPGVALDHEEAASLTLEVTATDNGGLSVTESFKISVTDVNEGPTSIGLEAPASGALSLNENGETGDVALLRDMADFPSDALTLEMRFQSVDPAPTHGVSVFSYAADGTSYGNEFLLWAPKGADGPLEIFVGGKRYQTGLEADEILDGGMHDLAVTWDQATGDLQIFVDGDLAVERTIPADPLKSDGTIALGQEQDAEGGRFDERQIFEGQVAEVRLFDHVRTADEIAENAGGPIDDPAGTDGLLLNWVMDEAVDGVVVDRAGDHDLTLGGTAHIVSDFAAGELGVLESAEGSVVGTLSVVDPDEGETHTFTVSDDRFEVVGGEVRLKPGVSLDHEEAASITLEVTATDSGGLSLTESFEVTVADVNEAPEQIALDSQTVIASEDGAVVGRIKAVDPDAGDALTFSVSDDRFEVVEGELRVKPGSEMSADDAALKLSVTATDSGGLSVTETFEINVYTPPTVSVGSGFTADYFDMDANLRVLSDIDWSADPTFSEVTQDIDYANGNESFWEGGSKDTFGARVQGNIAVDEGGTFTFHLGADDGAALYVNGQKLIDNDGEHSFRTRSGEIELPPGNHHIEVRYFENGGRAGLHLEWEGPGIDGRQLVEAPDDAIAGIEGVAVPLDLQISNLGDDAEIRLDGVPEGTIMHVSDKAMTAGEDGSIDLTGLDLSGLTIKPPHGSARAFDPQVVVAQPFNGEIIEVAHPIDIDVTEAFLPDASVELTGGFKATYFDLDHNLTDLDQVDWGMKPAHEEIVGDISYENSRGSFWEGGDTDTFAARIEGQIEVTEGGTYTFYLGGDDGVRLLINGKEVVGHDGLQSYRTREGKIELEPGEYDIEVLYFENEGFAGLKLDWEGPDTDGREPVTAKPDLEIEQNGTLEVAIHVDDGTDLQSVVIDGLPADTVVFLGEKTLVSDGGSLDVSGHDLDFLQIAPPSGFVGTIEGQVTTVSRHFNGQLSKDQTSFEARVGEDAVVGRMTVKQDGDVLIMESDADGERGAAAWTKEDDGDREDSSDNVMAEEIVALDDPKGSEEHMDTYERYDW